MPLSTPASLGLPSFVTRKGMVKRTMPAGNHSELPEQVVEVGIEFCESL
jgi:hypothetical protein